MKKTFFLSCGFVLSLYVIVNGELGIIFSNKTPQNRIGTELFLIFFVFSRKIIILFAP